MQFKYLTLTSAIVTAISLVNSVNAVAVQLRNGEIVTKDKILEWIATTEANLTFIGEPITKRITEDTMVVYCSVRTQDSGGRHLGGNIASFFRTTTWHQVMAGEEDAPDALRIGRNSRSVTPTQIFPLTVVLKVMII
ncbi:hypothetical protein HHX47_DHR2001084 [Lentinula edodes]|nr:hypothetical protein HHX47_DHR2001084 [Lentinula edodes]